MTELGDDAARLLQLLRRLGARSESRAVVDRVLASEMGVNPRMISDFADAALVGGYLVIASGRGRWLVEVGDPLDAARRYELSLRDRARAVFGRAAHVASVIEKHEQLVRVRSQGQGNLFVAVG